MSNPEGITVGPDGALWFVENQTNKIGRVTTKGVVTEISPTGISAPYPDSVGIALGPDKSLWFTECGLGKIARLR